MRNAEAPRAGRKCHRSGSEAASAPPRLSRFDYYYWGYIGIMEKKMETTIMGLFSVEGCFPGDRV